MPKLEIITAQYTQVARSLNQMFTEIALRTNCSSWRLKGGYESVGSCKHITKKHSQEGLIGPTRNILISLREEKTREVPGSPTLSPCPYHRENHGCILGELKSPLCISHIDNPQELQERFGIDGNSLRDDVRKTLKDILEGNNTDNQTTQQALLAITQMTDHIKRFPILH